MRILTLHRKIISGRRNLQTSENVNQQVPCKQYQQLRDENVSQLIFLWNINSFFNLFNLFIVFATKSFHEYYIILAEHTHARVPVHIQMQM